jgi:hypothetical protein
MIAKGIQPYRLALLGAAALLSACSGGGGGGGSGMLSALGSAPSQPASMPPTQAAPPAIPLSQAKFSFAPVTGAPISVLNSISQQLGREAYAQHITLVPAGDASANYVIKGYLSAVGDPSGSVLVYVWDIFDANGTRVHRISGQETTANGAADPWAGVGSDATANVARQTIGAIVAWGSANR